MFRCVAFVVISFAVSLFLGCGADEELVPGEEVLVKKWVDPVDIGKDYIVNMDVVQSMKEGPLLLDTGKAIDVTVGSGFAVRSVEDGVQVVSGVKVQRDGYVETVSQVEGYVVLEGPPIVTLHYLSFVVDGEWRSDVPVTKDNNVREYTGIAYSVTIDRVLDYNLPIYMEFQTRKIVTGEVHRGRFFLIVLKGNRYAFGELPTDSYNGIGSTHFDDRASLSVLPHTEAEEVDLPVTVLHSPDVPWQDRSIPEGYSFRPYRIRSSSFIMGVAPEVESNW